MKLNFFSKWLEWTRPIHKQTHLINTTFSIIPDAPRIRVGPYNPLRIMVNGDAALTCSVNANPPVRSVRWLKSGQLLSHTSNHTIPSVKPEDSGTYTCIAENGIGEATQINLELAVLCECGLVVCFWGIFSFLVIRSLKCSKCVFVVLCF